MNNPATKLLSRFPKYPKVDTRNLTQKAMVIKSGKVPKENYTMLPRSCLLAFSDPESREGSYGYLVTFPRMARTTDQHQKKRVLGFSRFFFVGFNSEPPKKKIQSRLIKLIDCIKRYTTTSSNYPFAF